MMSYRSTSSFKKAIRRRHVDSVRGFKEFVKSREDYKTRSSTTPGRSRAARTTKRLI